MTEIHEHENLRNQVRIFHDRFEAGGILARMMASDYADMENVMILSIPMGGVPVALKMSEIFSCPMDVVIVRKMQIPGNTESGFGAMTQEGDLFLNEPLVDSLRLSEEQVEQQKAKVRRELDERNRTLRGNRPFPSLEGRAVILVDDGLASGFTMKAASYLIQKRQAAKTIVAVPTAPRRTIDDLHGRVDAVYCANIREGFPFAVADAYKNWSDLSESQIRTLLSQA